MENKDRLKVGLKVWTRGSGRRALDSEMINECIVSKVGKKYFELNNDSRYKYQIENLRIVSDFSSSVVYFEKQPILDEIELAETREFLRKSFDTLSHTRSKYSLDQLRRVKQILDESCES